MSNVPQKVQDEFNASLDKYEAALVKGMDKHFARTARKAAVSDQPRDDHGRWTSGGVSLPNNIKFGTNSKNLYDADQYVGTVYQPSATSVTEDNRDKWFASNDDGRVGVFDTKQEAVDRTILEYNNRTSGLMPNNTKALSPKDIGVLREYTASSRVLNEYLHGPSKANLTDVVKERIAALDKVFDGANTAQATTVFRGVHDSGVEQLEAAWKSGNKEFTDKGYVSTSPSKAIARSFGTIYFSLELPKGSSAISLGLAGKTTNYFQEKEVLINRGQSFRLTSRTEEAGAYVHFTAELVK